ncbi:MAG: ATP-grasp domain-containing protein [Polyangiaceae bacterium]|nr:ATP-grasp domain-containing protein [Polyangiaceae bacterium]MCB9609263.1 ATP-grasp domain-containing protein [Polyangiaceae bacterium]
MANPQLFHRLLIANRGEVAVRIARACDALGIEPVFAYSEADRHAAYLEGRRGVCLGPGRASDSYLDAARVVQAAKQTDCSALHPGWGFLSENSAFASLCEAHGVSFVGPPAHVMHLMGTKSPAKRAMRQAGLTLIPGSDGPLRSAEHAKSVAEEVGLPVLIKAESGGGGRGMKIVRQLAEMEEAFHAAQREGQAFFGDPRVYLEKLVEGGRHIEIQVIADRYGNVCHLGERDCTIQRNHQKLIEESPSPVLDDAERERTLQSAVKAVRDIGYVGAGTLEFLLDTQSAAPGQPAVLRFMEMNTRLQVEHCVSEMRSGIDLVREQLLVAAGHPLSFEQADIKLSGHAIECRINAEDPSLGFRPSPGTISKWKLPDLRDGSIRVDTHVLEGYTIPPHYDSLICKVIAHADDREAATRTMLEALGELECEGVKTTIPMHQAVLASAEFAENRYDTSSIPGGSYLARA